MCLEQSVPHMTFGHKYVARAFYEQLGCSGVEYRYLYQRTHPKSMGFFGNNIDVYKSGHPESRSEGSWERQQCGSDGVVFVYSLLCRSAVRWLRGQLFANGSGGVVKSLSNCCFRMRR